MSRELAKMNMISAVQKLNKNDVECVQIYVEMIEQENQQLKEKYNKLEEKYLKQVPCCNEEDCELYKELQQLKEQARLYEIYLNRFFKINNKSYDGRIVLEQLKQRDEVIEKLLTNWNELEKYIDENKLILNNPNIFQFYLIQKEILTEYKGGNNE